MGQERNPALQQLLKNLNRPDYPLPRQSESLGHNNNLPGLGLLQSEQSASTELPPKLQHTGKVEQSVPDPSLITAWPAALKYVTKYVASNEKAVARIKHLIQEQHQHEQQWWVAREAIVAKHEGRIESQQKAAELLKSLGGMATGAMKIDAAADQAELVAYDKKVYGLLTKMAADVDRQLRSMGIPFYAIKHDLVILEAGLQKEGALERIDRGELREFQKKMLQTLEDLFMD